jgi:hypothetical protein
MLNDDDKVFVSPLNKLKRANEGAEILGLTPIKIEIKELKAKRALKIARKSELVRCKVKEVLEYTLLNDSIIPSSSTLKYMESDFVNLMENLKERCDR